MKEKRKKKVVLAPQLPSHSSHPANTLSPSCFFFILGAHTALSTCFMTFWRFSYFRTCCCLLQIAILKFNSQRFRQPPLHPLPPCTPPCGCCPLFRQWVREKEKGWWDGQWLSNLFAVVSAQLSLRRKASCFQLCTLGWRRWSTQVQCVRDQTDAEPGDRVEAETLLYKQHVAKSDTQYLPETLFCLGTRCTVSLAAPCHKAII